MEYAHNDEEGEQSTLVGEGAHCVVGGQRGNSLQEEKICLDRSEILGGQQAVLTKGCPITLDEIMSSSMTLGELVCGLRKVQIRRFYYFALHKTVFLTWTVSWQFIRWQNTFLFSILNPWVYVCSRSFRCSSSNVWRL